MWHSNKADLWISTLHFMGTIVCSGYGWRREWIIKIRYQIPTWSPQRLNTFRSALKALLHEVRITSNYFQAAILLLLVATIAVNWESCSSSQVNIFFIIKGLAKCHFYWEMVFILHLILICLLLWSFSNFNPYIALITACQIMEIIWVRALHYNVNV